MTDKAILERLARLIRYFILVSTTEAGSGHPTSSLSATDLLTALMFGGMFRFDVDNPGHPNNDRLVFSKGHASPLLYSLWAAAGKVSEQELKDIDAEVREIVNASADFAQHDPEPDPAELWSDVYR